MAEALQVNDSKIIDKRVAVHTFGSGGVQDLSKHIDDARLSWALLRCPTAEGCSTHEKIVAVVCHGPDMPVGEREQILSLSSRVLHQLGTADVTLHVKRGRELPEQLSAALASNRSIDESTKHHQQEDSFLKPSSCEVSAQQALHAMGSPSSPHDWVLLEPTRLELHKASSGGLDGLKECLPADKVMFGVLRFFFPRNDGGIGAPPIVKYLFIHWIGPKVSAVRRGQWNSKLEDAASKIRHSCEFAFRKTAYALGDLSLPHLIEELGRLTCVISSDARQFSLDWYLEGLEIAREAAGAARNDESQSDSSTALMPESVKHAIQIVRGKGRQWKWVLLTIGESIAFSSGGA